MSSTDSGQAASGRIEAPLQRVLEGVQQLESKVAAQSGQIQSLQNGLEGMQSKMDVVQADLDGVKGKLLVLDKLETAQSRFEAATKDELKILEKVDDNGAQLEACLKLLSLADQQNAMAAAFDRHVAAEMAGDLETTLSTMSKSPHIIHVPTLKGGVGVAGVREFYANSMTGKSFFPPDVSITTLSRTIGQSQLVDELSISFVHTEEIEWLAPGVAPTGRPIELVVVVIVGFDAEQSITHEHIYWDQAGVLIQMGMLQPGPGFPVTCGSKSSRRVRQPVAITLESLAPDDVDQVLEFAASIFHIGEVLEMYDPCHSLCKSRRFFSAVKPYLLGQFCTIAKDPVNGNVVGCRLVIDESCDLVLTNTFSEQVLEIWHGVRKNWKAQEAEHSTPGKWAHLIALCVAPSVRRLGLAKEMYRRTEQLLLDAGYEGLVVECSSAFSLAACISLDFVVHTRISYKDFVFSDGTKKYAVVKPPHEALVLLTKTLRQP